MHFGTRPKITWTIFIPKQRILNQNLVYVANHACLKIAPQFKTKKKIWEKVVK
jgi:hypothetical protein